jgi:hypothetical protein
VALHFGNHSPWANAIEKEISSLVGLSDLFFYLYLKYSANLTFFFEFWSFLILVSIT